MGKTQSKSPVKKEEKTKRRKRREKVIFDRCHIEELAEYIPPKLVEEYLIGSGKDSLIYTFDEPDKTYIIKYTPDKQKACVSKIKCKKKSKPNCKTFTYQVAFQQVVGNFNFLGAVIIKNVDMGHTKGHCSKAVAYMLKVLLIEAAKLNTYPYKGIVCLASGTQCAAVNCYSHAFQMNGFEPNMHEMVDFLEKNERKEYKYDGDSICFVFNKFRNTEQRQKALMKRKKERASKMMSNKYVHNELKF